MWAKGCFYKTLSRHPNKRGQEEQFHFTSCMGRIPQTVKVTTWAVMDGMLSVGCSFIGSLVRNTPASHSRLRSPDTRFFHFANERFTVISQDRHNARTINLVLPGLLCWHPVVTGAGIWLPLWFIRRSVFALGRRAEASTRSGSGVQPDQRDPRGEHRASADMSSRIPCGQNLPPSGALGIALRVMIPDTFSFIHHNQN